MSDLISMLRAVAVQKILRQRVQATGVDDGDEARPVGAGGAESEAAMSSES